MDKDMNFDEMCLHVHVKDGKIINAFSHLTNFPDNCVIHLKPDAVMTYEEFSNNHPGDKNELEALPEGKIHDLGDSSY